MRLPRYQFCMAASLVVAFSTTLLATAVLRAQERPAPSTASERPEFEVASVKPNASNDGRTFIQLLPGGGLRISGGTLKYLLTLAYEVRPFQISGGGGWIDSDRFDILAKSDDSSASENASGDASKPTEVEYKTMQEQMRPKLQTLLADRFQLRLHRETKEQRVYALVVGKNGTRLQPASEFRGLHIGWGQLTGNGATLEMLTTALAGQLGRPVLDRTGLKGAFKFKLEWSPESAQVGGSSPRGLDAAAPTDPGGPSMFTALEEQLGLKLESARGPVEILVIDHVEKPSQN